LSGLLNSCGFLLFNLQGADIELIMGLVNKKAWFRTVKPTPGDVLGQTH
jgi:hypothetical protein